MAHPDVARCELALLLTAVFVNIGAGATTRDDTVRVAAAKVVNSDAYAGLSVPLSAVHMVGSSSATVYACAVDISGGPKLGAILLVNATVGWIIVRRQPDLNLCPQPLGDKRNSVWRAPEHRSCAV
jgi:hypothetical protein